MVEPLLLVRDVLDNQIYDVEGKRLGKVDGLVLQPRQGRPPRLVAVESSMPAAWRRVWPRLGDWVERFQHWLAPDLAPHTRIRFEHVVQAGIDVKVDIEGNRTDADVWENWIRRTFIEKLPGGKPSGEED